MRPYVVAEVRTPAGALVQKTQPACVRQVIRPETSALMRQMMEAVVAGGGGQKAQIAGYRVGAKAAPAKSWTATTPPPASPRLWQWPPSTTPSCCA